MVPNAEPKNFRARLSPTPYCSVTEFHNDRVCPRGDTYFQISQKTEVFEPKHPKCFRETCLISYVSDCAGSESMLKPAPQPNSK